MRLGLAEFSEPRKTSAFALYHVPPEGAPEASRSKTMETEGCSLSQNRVCLPLSTSVPLFRLFFKSTLFT